MSTYDGLLPSAAKLGLLLGSMLVMAQQAGCSGPEIPDPGETGGSVGTSGGSPPGSGGVGGARASGGAGGLGPIGGAGSATGGTGGVCGTGCTLASTPPVCAAPTVLLLCQVPMTAERVGILTANGCAMAEMEGAPGFCCPPEILDQCA